MTLTMMGEAIEGKANALPGGEQKFPPAPEKGGEKTASVCFCLLKEEIRVSPTGWHSSCERKQHAREEGEKSSQCRLIRRRGNRGRYS